MRHPATPGNLLASLAALLLVCLIPSPQISAQALTPAGNPNDRTSVSGTVVNSESNEPIHGALVQLGPMSTMTDDKGYFHFDGVPTTTVMLFAHKPGYFSPTEMRNQFQQTQMLQIAPGLAPSTVKLIPEAIISGQVTSSDGEPLDSIPIELVTSVINDGIRMWQQRGGAQTDDEGRFRIAELPPGTYYIAAGPSRAGAIPPAISTNSVARQSAYSKAYFPSGIDISSASPVTITAGKHIEANFTLAEQPTYRISGVVNGYAQNQGVSIQVNSSSGGFGGGVAVNPRTGIFSTGFLAAGTYTIRATARGIGNPAQAQLDENSILSARTTVDLTSDISGLHLMLAAQPGIPVKTKVDWPSKPPNANFPPATIQLFPEDSSRSVHQIRGSTAPFGPNGPRDMFIRDVDPGRYRVDIRPNGPLYVASATYGDVDLLREDLVIGSDIGSQPIEIDLRDDGGDITATVTGLDANPRGVVFYVSEENPRRVYMSFMSNRGASYLGSVPPGTYRVFALDDADGIEYRKPDALQDFLSAASEVTVGPKAQSSVTIPLTHRQN